MACLIHNQTFRVSEGDLQGIYRVVLTEASIDYTAVVFIEKLAGTGDNDDDVAAAHAATPTKAASLRGQLIWIETAKLEDLQNKGLLQMIEIERENFNDSPAGLKRFELRKAIMEQFLSFETLRASILSNGSIGRLVAKAKLDHGIGRTLIYKCWSLLCRYGFSEQSLRSRFDRCGAPNKTRDCASDGRKKAGRKTNHQRVSKQTGMPEPITQPGMNAQWRQLVLMADRKISLPKPAFPERFRRILEEGFTKHFIEVNGVATPKPLEFGQYPNKRQVRRVLEIEIPRLQRLRERTTKGHYNRSMRGMTGRSWKGVSGPGHTWQIDSTIADMYLRSSINRAWIIGRPVVYIMVDVWSTAIVGFYVCLRGPSWEMARNAFFSAVASPDLMGDLWGYEPIETLSPHPGIPPVLLCDRGEYISQAAKDTAYELIERMSYTPPYRPDLKGLVEVLHRIKKDHQQWIPGAIDARRAEYELRQFDPHKAIFTVQEYTQYLHGAFAEYNLTADRRKRLDTHMIAAGVAPTPAGLWRWGHDVGIGTIRHRPQSELITTLLSQREASVTREGIQLDRLAYTLENDEMADWTARARNFGSWKIPVYHYPGTVSRIWTPNIGGSGLIDLKLSAQANASSSQTFEEVEDAFAYGSLAIPKNEHERVQLQVDALRRSVHLVSKAKAKTQSAVKQKQGPMPSLSEARAMESHTVESTQVSQVPNDPIEYSDDESDAFLNLMDSLLKVKHD